jgi:hypothetical protein
MEYLESLHVIVFNFVTKIGTKCEPSKHTKSRNAQNIIFAYSNLRMDKSLKNVAKNIPLPTEKKVNCSW